MATPSGITLYDRNVVIEITGIGITPQQPSTASFGTVRQIATACNRVQVGDLVFFNTVNTRYFLNGVNTFCTLPETDCFFKYTTPP